ncbi:hypothetical protein CMUS01_07589 [Colletotrichum musicola]|uniref:Uncharacterized protein n=1 Tax=Colletotrichum musicola TaxID=2175873 RepID=A0A8H6KGU6_9PEZI|nr:hypothetical protein CMUS01_07589 [Colletotrichum musicola]
MRTPVPWLSSRLRDMCSDPVPRQEYLPPLSLVLVLTVRDRCLPRRSTDGGISTHPQPADHADGGHPWLVQGLQAHPLQPAWHVGFPEKTGRFKSWGRKAGDPAGRDASQSEM